MRAPRVWASRGYDGDRRDAGLTRIAAGAQSMRIPTHKIYRAFPELDRFSDEECERMMVRAGGGRFGTVSRGRRVYSGLPHEGFA